MLPRFYFPAITLEDNRIILRDAEIMHQILSVLHLKKNDIFIIFTPQQEYEVTIKKTTADTITLTVLAQRRVSREPTKKLTLYQALLKKNNFEWILQKGTELGIDRFVPIITDNTIVRHISPVKQRRYQKIITEAIEQCGGTEPPELVPPQSFTDALQTAASEDGHKLIAYEGEQTVPLSDHTQHQALHLFIGPEGGFTPDEITAAQKHHIVPVHLGPRILRAETAAIASCSLVLLS